MNDLVAGIIAGDVVMVGHRTYKQSNGNLMAGGDLQIIGNIWGRIVAAKQTERLWLEGAVTLPKSGKQGAVEFTKIELERYHVNAIAERHRPLAIPEIREKGDQGPSKGSRHGAPLAYMTMHLWGMKPTEQRKLSRAELTDMVTKAYCDLHLPPPGQRNAAGIGKGILDALRSMNESPWVETEKPNE